MFNLFKKKEPQLPTSNFKWLSQDIHSHLLPGIDDGSPDVATSIQLLQSLSSAGIKDFICTPHIISDLYRNTPETISKALAILKEACVANNLDVNLRAAAEYMIDDGFKAKLENGEPLLTLEKNYILTEFSYYTLPSNLNEITFQILSNNYLPLAAHPERYHYYHNDFDAFFKLQEAGFLLQVNILSITGYYGKSVAKAAKFILKNNLAAFVGTDLHHENHLKALINPKSAELFEEYFGDKIFNEFE
ncbi:MAG: CpsB/CapC family capsule biosynthesis tyrosine phosphatase [Ginsengibacter sp.]|jgi:tyrosine-protein phosphatase YwqE